MTRKGRCAGSMRVLYPRESFSLFKPEKETFAFYCAQGWASAAAQGERFSLCRDETLLVSDGAGELYLAGDPVTILIFARIYCV